MRLNDEGKARMDGLDVDLEVVHCEKIVPADHGCPATRQNDRVWDIRGDAGFSTQIYSQS